MRAGSQNNYKQTTANVVAVDRLTPAQRLDVIAQLNGRARMPPTPKVNGECCMEFPGEYRLREFKFKNSRPMIRVNDDTWVQAQTVAFWIKYQRRQGPGMTVSHLCGNPQCVNPVHMAEMTIKENKQYGMKFEKEDAAIRALAEKANRVFGYRTGSEADEVLKKLGYGVASDAEETAKGA